MRQLIVVLFALVCIFGCGSPSDSPALAASVVVMGERIADQSDPDVAPHVEQYPECMAVAVGPELVVTSDHCPAGSVDGVHVLVTHAMWTRTTSGNVLADTIRVRGEVRELRPRRPLDVWIDTAAAGPGDATRVVVRGSEMVELATTLDGDSLSGDIDPGDSGGPIFQRPAVGLTQTCRGTAEGVCDLGGGRFSPP